MKNIFNKILFYFLLVILSVCSPPTLALEQIPNTKTAQIQIEQTPLGFLIQVNSELIFDIADIEILKSGYEILDKIAKIIKQHNGICIIECHTFKKAYKNSPISSDWELTIIQSNQIIEYFINYHNINPTRLNAHGFGELIPSKKFNNRIDFLLIEQPD